MAVDGNPRWLLAAKIWFLGVFQLGVLVPIWAVLQPEQAAASAILFFLLFPFLLYPIVYGVGRLYEVYDVDDWFSWTEVCIVGAGSAAALPLLILLPIYSSVVMAETTRDMLLGFIIALPSVWIPVLVGAAWGPAVAEWRQLLNRAAADKVAATLPVDEPAEMRAITAGIFGFVSVPLGFFVPLYLGVEHEEPGEAAMVFFMLVTNVAAFQVVIAPRLGLQLHVARRVGTTVSVPEAIAKLLYGASLLPMVVLLPLYRHGDIREQAKRTLAVFMLGLPPLCLLEAVRVAHREALDKLPVVLALVYFGLVMPLGILLPAWLAGEPDGTGQSLFLVFMMSPLTLCLLIAAMFTWRFEPRLPFQPLDFFIDGEHRRADYAFAATAIVLPALLLLPIYFEAPLEDTPALITISFFGIITGALLIMFGISLSKATAPELKSADVLNLPYASTQEVLRTARLDTDPFSPGRKTANSSRAALSLAALSPGQGEGDGYRDRTETGMTAMSGLTNFDDDEPQNPAHNSPDDMSEAVDEDLFHATGQSALKGRRESNRSVAWGGWEAGMECKAEYPLDGGVYDATIVALDWETRRARVAYKGYAGDEHEVGISRLYSADASDMPNTDTIEENPLSPIPSSPEIDNDLSC